MSASPNQTQPGLKLPARRKLIPLEFFCVFHGMETRAAVALIDSQDLWPAFNMSISREGRRSIRVLREAVERWQPDQSKSGRPGIADIVTTAILPPLGLAPAKAVTIRAAELAFRFCLYRDTFRKFLEAGELTEVGRHNVACESPRVAYLSVAAFLARRLI